jgi:hypothetical protein
MKAFSIYFSIIELQNTNLNSGTWNRACFISSILVFAASLVSCFIISSLREYISQLIIAFFYGHDIVTGQQLPYRQTWIMMLDFSLYVDTE